MKFNIKNYFKKAGKMFLSFCFFVLLFISSKNALALDIPELKNYVTDKTNTLTSSEINSLEEKLSNFDKTTSNQIVVLVIDSLNGETYIEDYSMQVAMKNKIGTEEKDNGVLLLIIKDDHELRIEVGYGLEGFLTDAKSSYIIRNFITPFFKEEKYFDGINNGVDEILKACSDAEYLNEEVESEDDDEFLTGLIFFIIMNIIFIIIATSNGNGRGGLGKALFWGSVLSGGNHRSGGSFGGGSGFGGGFHGGGGSFGGGGSSGKW